MRKHVVTTLKWIIAITVLVLFIALKTESLGAYKTGMPIIIWSSIFVALIVMFIVSRRLARKR